MLILCHLFKGSRFWNKLRMTWCDVFRMTKHCHPELVSGSGFAALNWGGPLTDNVAFSSDQRFLASVQQFLDRDAETSSAWLNAAFPKWPHIVIPNLFRDLYFDPLGGRWTVDGQRDFHQRSAYFSKRSAVLRSRCWNKFSMTECGVSEMTTHCHPELVSGFLFCSRSDPWLLENNIRTLGFN